MDVNKDKARRRLRRRRHIRKRIFGSSEKPRLSVSRSLHHIYCQLIDDSRGVTLCSASSLTIDGTTGGNRAGATAVGALLAQRAKEHGITKVAFDRNGYPYHGRVAALADAVRKEGIEV